MSGIIKHSDNNSWNASTWIFDNILEAALKDHRVAWDDGLRSKLEMALHGAKYLDVRDLTAPEFDLFLTVMKNDYVRYDPNDIERGKDEFYQAFLRKYMALIDALDSYDPGPQGGHS